MFALVKRRLQLLYLISFAVEPYVEDRQALPLYKPRVLQERSVTDEQLANIERGAFLTGVRMMKEAINSTPAMMSSSWPWQIGVGSTAEAVMPLAPMSAWQRKRLNYLRSQWNYLMG